MFDMRILVNERIYKDQINEIRNLGFKKIGKDGDTIIIEKRDIVPYETESDEAINLAALLDDLSTEYEIDDDDRPFMKRYYKEQGIE